MINASDNISKGMVEYDYKLITVNWGMVRFVVSVTAY